MSDAHPTPPGAANGAAPPGPAAALPPLYRALEPVSAERHGGLRIRPAGFAFAAAAHAVPLAAEEFVAAARSLPIVFTAEAPHMPVALTGLAAGANLFVGPGGAWREGAYIPAYLRRVPFFLLRLSADSEELALCLDPTAAQLDGAAGEPLFTEEGAPAPALDRALGFAKAVEEAMLRTRGMAVGLAELGLLRPSVVEFEQDGRPLRVDGFCAVDRAALQALPAERLAALRDRGWLEAVYAHLLSVGGLSSLARSVAPG